MKPNSAPASGLFKGIVIFTPGGDLIYCIDPDKQNRWHLHLCAALQEIMNLPEPPHFLTPCLAATVDRWQDPQTEKILTIGEAAPAVLRYQALLNVIFETENLVWQPAQLPEGVGDPAVMMTYRHQFPQLWQSHDLVIRFEQKLPSPVDEPPTLERLTEAETQGYVFRLFVSGHSTATERTLQTLHHLLEQSLGHPYTLKVIDVFQHPEQAELDQVAATPTLVKVWPQPVRRIVGNLDNVDQLLRVLGSPATWRSQ